MVNSLWSIATKVTQGLLICILGFTFALAEEAQPKDFEGMRSELSSWVQDGALPNLAVQVLTANKTLFHHHAGVLDYELKTPIQRDSLFRIYSMTKSVTALAAMMLVEQGKLALDDPISQILPEFENLAVWSASGSVPASSMTLRHLLSHTSGISYGYYGDTPVDVMYREAGLIDDWDYLVPTTADLVRELGQIPLLFQPGERYHYGFSSDVVGHVIERVTELPLDDYLNEHLWHPLGVTDAYFDVPVNQLSRFGTNHFAGQEAGQFVIQDTPRVDPEFLDVTFLSGGGGLVMSIDGFAKFVMLLLGNGVYDGQRLISKESLAEAFTNQIPTRGEPSDFRYGLGFGIRSVEVAEGQSREIYFWGGAAGTSFWVDPTTGIGGIFMTQLIGAPGELSQTFSQLTYKSLAN